MSKRNHKNVAAMSAAATAALAGVFGQVRDATAAPVNLTATTYTQNFDHSTWAKQGGSAMGTGWALSETGTGANSNYVDGSGSSATADTYVFHTGNDNDLAFGTLRGATTLVSTIGANFANTLGAGNNIVAVQISYTGEQWRRGGTGTDQLDFQISTNATSLTTGTWTDHNALDFASLQNSGAAAALDGNNAANRNTGISSTIIGLNIANNGQFWIRWNDADNTVEHGLGLEDFSLKALTTGYDSTITASGSVGFGRVMQNLTPSDNSSASLSKTGDQGTNYTATASNNGITVTAPGTFGTGNPEAHNITVALANNANGSGTTGLKNFTVTIDNTSATSGAAGQGSADANDTINVSATVLANRIINASTVALGRRMVGVGISGTSNLTTSGDNNNFTAVTIQTTGGPNGDGITVAGGTGTLFDAAADTGTRTLGGSFSTTGSKSSSVTVINNGEGLAGEAPVNVSVGYTATALDNRVVNASSVALGRRMVNVAQSGVSNLSTTGDNNNRTAVTIPTTSAADGNGISVTGGTGTAFNATGSTGTRNVGGTFTTTGVKSGTLTLNTVGEGLAGEAPINVSVGYTATAVGDRVVTASTIPLGRRMVGTALGGTSNLATSGDDDNNTRVTVATTGGPNGDGVTVTGGSGTSFDDAADTGSRNLGGSFTTTGAKSGSVMLTTTGEGLAGETPIDVAVGYTGTSVDNRVVSASSVGFGTTLINNAVNGSSNLSTTGDDDNFTRVTVALTGGPDGNGVDVSGGTGALFDAAADTGIRNLEGNFAVAGAYSGSITLTTTGEGLAGEAPVDVPVAYTATALDHSNASFDSPGNQDVLTINFGQVALNSSQSQGFNLFNLLATAGFTAALDLDNVSGSGDVATLTTNLANFSNLGAGTGNSYTAFFDTSTLGTFSATYLLSVSDEDLPGAQAGDDLTLNITGEVVPEPTSAALMALAAGALCVRRRRRLA